MLSDPVGYWMLRHPRVDEICRDGFTMSRALLALLWFVLGLPVWLTRRLLKQIA